MQNTVQITTSYLGTEDRDNIHILDVMQAYCEHNADVANKKYDVCT